MTIIIFSNPEEVVDDFLRNAKCKFKSNVIFLLKTFSNHLTKISDQFLIADIRQLMHMRAFILTILYFMV